MLSPKVDQTIARVQDILSSQSTVAASTVNSAAPASGMLESVELDMIPVDPSLVGILLTDVELTHCKTIVLERYGHSQLVKFKSRN